MVFGLTIGTDRAAALQKSIQDELAKRGYGNDSDIVMAEYITIMIINNKTPAQITSELEDLITDYDSIFTDWLFTEAAKGAPDAQAPPTPAPQRQPEPTPSEHQPIRDPPPHLKKDTRLPPSARSAPIYQQALSQAQSSGIKRPARSPSPSSGHGPNKTRRTELPAGPRAMLHRESNNNGSGKSLLDRVGPRNGFEEYPQQPRWDAMPNQNFSNGVNPQMDMNGMAAAAMGNPMMLQEMMMSQMAMMAQMAGAMGLVNPAQFANGMNPGAPGFQDMAMVNGMNNFPPQQQQQTGRGRQNGRGTGGRGRGRGGFNNRDGDVPTDMIVEPQPAPVLAAPKPTVPAAAPSPATKPNYATPERPQSPTLCKFSLKCTNASCRYSHPSPVATAESGVVLSNDPCEKGKNCKDKDCIKAHVSPAVLNPQAVAQNTPTATPAHQHQPPPCRFGAGCTRIHTGCTFTHPPSKTATQCRFGTACTRADCKFQHPEGRVLPGTFHRGLGTDAPTVSVVTPQPGSIGTASNASQHKSMTFVNREKEELERKMKELEEKKKEAQRQVAEARKAAASKKEPVAIAT